MLAAEHAELKRRWHVFGEGPEVASGFRSPLRSALEKARRAHGFKSSEPDPPNLPPMRFINPLNTRQVAVRPRGAARRSRA